MTSSSKYGNVILSKFGSASLIGSVSTTLLIRDDNNTQMGAENLLEGLEIFSGKKNLKNEIVILNSYSLSEKIVKELNLSNNNFNGLYDGADSSDEFTIDKNVDGTFNVTEHDINADGEWNGPQR